ncbi:MAG: hypothetical protein H7A46_17105 [Verrucomicrobiales bacterium]|nr:hypothetical protein [Verrucomicrobiales bacterium]
MIKRILLTVFALALLAAVAWLGFVASQDSGYVVWFGLAAAILAPFAFMVLGQAFRAREHEILTQLSKVPHIREMMRRASSEEERIRILESERQKLDETIRVEARRLTLSETRSRIETELHNKIREYDATIEELRRIDQEVEESPVREEITRVRKAIAERKRGRVIVVRFGKRERLFPVRRFGDDPFSMALLLTLHLIEKLQNRRNPRPALPAGHPQREVVEDSRGH